MNNKELERLKSRLLEHRRVASHPSISTPLDNAISGAKGAADISTALRDNALKCVEVLIGFSDLKKSLEQRIDILEPLIITSHNDTLNAMASVDIGEENRDLHHQLAIKEMDLDSLNFLKKVEMTMKNYVPYVYLDPIKLYIVFDNSYFNLLVPEKNKILIGFRERSLKAAFPLLGFVPFLGGVISIYDSFNKWRKQDELSSTGDTSDKLVTLDKINDVLALWVKNSSLHQLSMKKISHNIENEVKDLKRIERDINSLEKKYEKNSH
jgi:hypothetical protein